MKNKKFLAGEEAGTYIVPEQVTEADILDMALKLARGRLSKGRKIEQPSSAFSYLQTLMHEYEHEVFGVLFLDTKHRAQGIDLSLSLPADTLFTPENLKDADAVLAMYHDQGLPVLKSQGFGEAINITLGLPFIRTSVDHGTALSLAGTGQAKSSSLNVAVDLALDLARH